MTTSVNNMTTKQPPQPRRSQLAAVTRGRIEAPMRALLYSVEGVGKSTFGASAPSPIFLGTEDGTGQLDVARLPEPKTWSDVLDAVRELASEDHPFSTLVVDSLDWLEPLVFAHVCKRANVATIEDVGGGFGKGYVAALDEWRIFLAAIESMRRAKRMHVVLLAHAHIKTFRNPEGADYDRFTLKMNEKAAGLLKEFCDAVLFAHYETHVKTERGKDTKGKAFGGARVMYTERRPAFDAKNRYGLPETLPLSWDEFAAAVKLTDQAAAAKAATLRAEIEAMRDRLGDAEIATKTNDWLAKHGASVEKLSVLHNSLTAKLNTKETA